MKINRFFTYAFGCRVNEAEKEEIDRKMHAAGYIFDQKNPDIYIVNTCSITHKAEREAMQLVNHIKRNFPKTKIVITGCATTYWMKNSLHSKIPVDLMVDNINKDYLVDLIQKRLSSKPDISHDCQENVSTVNKFIGSGRVMVKIQDGCQRFCTFCIVPYLRGLPKSSKISDVTKKVNFLSLQTKISEVVLTAINTQGYGYDTGEKFIQLVESVIDKTIVPRISFGSIHPWSLDESFYDFYKKTLPMGRLVNFFHIPLQSGSKNILQLMKRGYTREEFTVKLNLLKNINPNSFIATDIIVGFLDESDADFDDTYRFLESSPISKFHVFRFSRRSKTAADYMAKRLMEPSSSTKAKRSEALIKLSSIKMEKFLISQIDRYSTALLLEKKFNGFHEALLDNQLPVVIASRNKKLAPGAIENIKIMEYKKGRLFGKIV